MMTRIRFLWRLIPRCFRQPVAWVYPVEQLNRGYGFVRRDVCRDQVLVAIIPINYPMRAFHLIGHALSTSWPLPLHSKAERESWKRFEQWQNWRDKQIFDELMESNQK